MSYSGRMQQNHSYSVFFAPRGRDRMYDLGMQIAQLYLSPFDKLIGIIGEAGSGKSMLIKGMFPGLELTNDDDGVNVRPLPILDLEGSGFFTAHTAAEHQQNIRVTGKAALARLCFQSGKRGAERGKRGAQTLRFHRLRPLLALIIFSIA